MRAQMTIDPRLLKMLGDKLYSLHPLPIIVRELLQNARDACVRKQVSPRIRIAIICKSRNDTVVICEDNGIGMTEEQLLNDFLCLGNTSKNMEQSAIGGFGIAKAALMRNDIWSVHTLDNYIDQDHILEGKEITKCERIEGTLVEVHITEDVWDGNFISALTMIYGSDVDVHLTAKYRTGDIYEDPHAGWQSGHKTQVREGIDWTMFTFPAFLKEMNNITLTFQGRTLYRLAGLVQYTKTNYSGRKFNLIADFFPTVRPEDPNYPFTMSREGLTDSHSSLLSDLVSEFDENPISAELEIEAINSGTEPTIEVRKGYTLRGTRNIPEKDENELYRQMDGEDTAKDISEMLKQASRSAEPQSLHQSLYLENFDDRPETRAHHAVILSIWRDIMLLCCDYYDYFGVGFQVKDRVNASRVYFEGTTYYCINPTIITNAQSYHAAIALMHFLACHEAAHYHHSSHGELHSCTHSDIYIETIEEVVNRTPRYLRMLMKN